MTKRLFRFRRLAVAALTGATVVGGMTVIGAGTASAVTYAPSPAFGASDSFQTFVTAPGADQPASDFLASFENSFATNDVLTFQIEPNGNANCTSADASIGFAGSADDLGVSVSADPSNTGTGETAPTITASLSSVASGCSGFEVDDTLTLTITNSATGLTTGDTWDVDVSGIEYNVGSAVSNNPVGVALDGSGTFNEDTSNESGLSSDLTNADVSNAIVSNVTVGANSPPVAVDLPHSANQKAENQPISDITLTEAAGGVIGGTSPDNYVCISIDDTTIDTSTSVPTVSASGGDGVPGTLSVINNGEYIVFPITTPSTDATTYTVSGINIDTDSNNFHDVYVEIGQASGSCGTVNALPEQPPAYYASTTHPLFGAGVDDTAQAEFQYFEQFHSGCAPNNDFDYPAVLARDESPYDALGGAYLAGELDTSTLLTPGSSASTVSNSTLNALRIDGVQTVYVLGGPGAISAPIVTELQNTPAYECGGATTVGTTANPVNLTVIRIWGNTADDTAAAISQWFGSGNVGVGKFPGAYGSAYNDTSGSESSAPINTGLRTAFVGTDNGWQDAASAGPVAWENGYPILLTPTGGLGSAASAALSNLNIEQVIVMGGPFAVSNTAVSQIQAMGISVLRVAGIDFTDTSQLFARFVQNDQSTILGSQSLKQGLGWDDADVFVARGDYFGDSLAGAAAAGNNRQPILLSANSNAMGQYMAAYFTQAGTEDGAYGGGYVPYVLRILGGPVAFTPGLIQSILTAVSTGDDAG